MQSHNFIRICLFSLAMLALSVQAQTRAAFELMQQKWDRKPAAELLAAAQANDVQAQYFYWRRESQGLLEAVRRTAESAGLIYKMPPAVQKNFRAKWKDVPEDELAKAAKDGNAEAQIVLDERKFKAIDTRSRDAFPFLEQSADRDFAPAECEAALYYLQMTGYIMTGSNVAKGLDLMRKAADHGWSDAQYYMAAFFLRGELIAPDVAKAIEYFQQAADQGSPSSQYELARLYAGGFGLPRGPNDEPVALLRGAAAKTNLPALHELAERYRLGLGVSMDYVKAARFYQKAWQAGQRGAYDHERISDAMTGLVEANLEPKPGLNRELAPFAKILSVYLNATEKSNAAAMSQIGQWYQIGRFVPKDMVEAFRWFNGAADLGGAEARRRREEIQPKLSPAQLEQARNPPWN